MIVPKILHQLKQPRKIPRTIAKLSGKFFGPVPKLAKIPIKGKIVIGFVKVRKKTSTLIRT